MLRTTVFALAASTTLAGAALADNHTEETSADMTIVETAQNTDGFSTLVTAVQEAGLVETLNGEGPFTVFAPTDAAFEALPEGALDELLANPEQLGSVLTYHVVPGKVMAADLEDGMTAETVNGEMLEFSVGDSVTVNGTAISDTDIEASNGVIHVIDGVLMPEGDM